MDNLIVAENLLTNIINNKFSKFTVTNLNISNPFIVCSPAAESMLLVNDLTTIGCSSPIGCLTLENTRSSETENNLPIITCGEAKTLMDCGTNLIITTSSLVHVFSMFAHDDIRLWIDQIYLAKKHNALVQHDPSIFLFLNWLQNYSVKIDQKIANVFSK